MFLQRTVGATEGYRAEAVGWVVRFPEGSEAGVGVETGV